MVRGVAVAALEHRHPGQTFTLLGDDVSATAKGTVFALQRDDGHAPAVIVLEGSVEVLDGHADKADGRGAYAMDARRITTGPGGGRAQ